ncbi:hypothetical protein UFOVP75_206 [uncultured Caudovirales phage]|uniref:Uncharacterized protein n=1 Tax=uncultured Caudovirales phage TaxID=2100421 RepID=A0A6J5L2K1_9CAUD|nr:hypothetical protein UFOVP75_206 [uncultured Caudovirales phage]
MTLTPKTRALLEEEVLAGRLAADVVDGNLIHLDKLPIINAKFTKQVSFFQLFGKEWDLLKLRAEKKVVDSVYAELYPKGPSAGFKAKYGEEAAKWLAEQGFTEYSGFSPKSVTAEATDFYMGKELHLKIKGYSALPSLNDVRKRIKDGNLTPSASLMVPYLNDIESLQKKFDAESYKFLLEARSKELVKQIRAMICEMAQVRFAIIVGQIWFYEMGSIEENTKTIQLGSAMVSCTAELVEKKFTI